jgi:outer membrane immunogenic protein
MKKFILPLAVALSFLPVIACATPGTYVQGELGMVALSNGTNGMFEPVGNPSGGVGRLSVGQLWGDNNFNYGLEGGFRYFSHADTDLLFIDTTYKGYDLDLLGVAKYTFNSGFSLFAKAGGAYVHQTVTGSVDGTSFSTSESGSAIAPELALGMGYQFNSGVALNLTADTIFAGGPSNSNPVATVNSMLLGLSYRFA